MPHEMQLALLMCISDTMSDITVSCALTTRSCSVALSADGGGQTYEPKIQGPSRDGQPLSIENPAALSHRGICVLDARAAPALRPRVSRSGVLPADAKRVARRFPRNSRRCRPRYAPAPHRS